MCDLSVAVSFNLFSIALHHFSHGSIYCSKIGLALVFGCSFIESWYLVSWIVLGNSDWMLLSSTVIDSK